MPRIKLTKEISQTIKNLRNDKNIKAVDLAIKLDKSLAYVSKLENANLKYIDPNTLIDIFKFLKADDQDIQEFISATLEKQSIEFTPEEMKKQQWLVIFDNELRMIPIPNPLIKYIKNKLNQLNITSKAVIQEMNKNTELSSKNINLSKYKTNSLIIEESDKEVNSFIIFDLKEDLLENILQNKIKNINYITMEGIIRILLILEGVSLKDASEKSIDILNEYKFYSLYQKKKILRDTKNEKIIDDLLTEYDKENIDSVNKILSYIKLLSDWNIEYTNKKLIELCKNFDFDASYTLAILSMKFYKLDNLKKEDKKNFLKELSSLIDKYSEIKHDDSNNFKEY